MRSSTKHVSLVVALFCVGLWGFGQDLKTIRGTLVSDSLDVSAIHVVNKTSGATTITNSDGNFKLGAQVQDTLVFSAVHIQFLLDLENLQMVDAPLSLHLVETFSILFRQLLTKKSPWKLLDQYTTLKL